MTPDSIPLVVAGGLLIGGLYVLALTSAVLRQRPKSAKLADLAPPYRIEPPRVIARRVVHADRDAAAVAAFRAARRAVAEPRHD